MSAAAGSMALGPPPAALRWYRRLVVAALGFSLLVMILSVGSLATLLGRPYGGFLWSWDNTHGLYRVDNFSPAAADTLQPADFVLAVAGQDVPAGAAYRIAQQTYRSAGEVCAGVGVPADAATVSYRVIRRGERLDVVAPIRCFRVGTFLRIAAIPVVLGLLIWSVGISVVRAGPQRELNLVFAFCAACAANSVVIQSAQVPDVYTPWGRYLSLFVVNPSPILAATALLHISCILPRQHPSRALFRARWLWYGLIPMALVVVGTVRYLLAPNWHPLIGSMEVVAWWGIALFLASGATFILLRNAQIFLTTRSRQAKSQARLIGLSMAMIFLAAPFVIAQQEPQLVSWIPINQPVLVFWLLPTFTVMAFAILRFQVFPGRVRGLNVLVGLAVTVVVAMAASPIPLLDPEIGFVALLAVLAGISVFWAIPNPVLRVLRHFGSPETIERAAIEQFNADIQEVYDPEWLPAAIVQSLEKRLRLRFAALWLVQPPDQLVLEVYTDRAPAADLPDRLPAEVIVAAEPTRLQSGLLAEAGCKIMLPLVAGGRQVGVIGAGERWTEEVFDDTDLVAMGVMADQAALTLGTARQIRALRMVPLQLEQAQLDERDRIAQDLHDSTQAQLAQLAFALERVRGQLYADPARAEESLDDCIQDVNLAARDLRAILRDLIPQRLLGRTVQSGLQEYIAGVREDHPAVDILLPRSPRNRRSVAIGQANGAAAHLPADAGQRVGARAGGRDQHNVTAQQRP